MDTRRLKHFLAVYQHGSIGQAAEALLLTQPALSKSIRQLERDLNVTLFERTPLGVVPTVYGEALAVHARVIQAELLTAETELSTLKGTSRGKVTVGIGPSIAVNLMPAATLLLAERAPGIHVTVVEGLVDDLIPAVRRGEVDLAIGSWPRPTDADLAAQVLFQDEIRVLAHRDHPLAGRPVQHGELLDYPWALPPETQRWRLRLNEFFITRSLPPPEAKVASNSAAYLKSLLRKSRFLTFLPTQLIRLGDTDNSIVPLDVDIRLTTEVSMTHRQRGRLTPATHALVAAVKEVAAGLLPVAA